MGVLALVAIFILTIKFLDKCAFRQLRFSNYFVNNMMGIVSSTPVNIAIFMYYMYC